MLTEYHFEIEHVKKLDNARADTLSRKKELQKNNKISETLFKKDSNKRIRYNYLQLSGIYKAPKSLWSQWIKKAKEIDSDYKDYKGKEMQLEVIYISSEIAKEYITEFYKGIT